MPTNLANGMALHGTLPEFSGKDWSYYVDRMGFYFEANDIDIRKRRAILLSVVGNETYTMLRSLSAPREPGELGVVHNCQHLPISTESTNLGGGGGGEGASVLFLKC